ncbi:MAG: 30S ribosomal protein S12 methylthiotransferase RimO [Clostridium sp.]|nr:30S ribosomal protein S12 methylthiotransferase RimO [Clostridium sp.]
MKNIRVALVSLGCAKNLVDSEIMLSHLQAEDFILVAKPEDADAIIVNTCGFIDTAKEESIEKILEMASFKQKDCRVLLAAGCLAQRFGVELLAEITELDGIFGINDVYGAAEAIRRGFAGERPVLLQGEYRPPEDASRLLATPSHTAYLKIAEGCNNNCTYCAIPVIRGPYRSRDCQVIVAEAKKLAAGGVKEINLIAQDITLFGLERSGQLELPALLQQLSAIPGLHWIRLLYAYPERISQQIIESVARLDKVCNYLDLPFQHGSDRILRRMGRKTTVKKNMMLLNSLREQIPGITLRSSFIVGFPGEEEADFQALLDFLQEARLERVGFFAYSREVGTPAARFHNQVSDELKEERVARAVSLQSRIMAEKQKLLVGQTVQAMIDGRSAQDKGLLLARSSMQAPEVDGYIRIRDNNAKNGELVRVEITGFEGCDQLGKILIS